MNILDKLEAILSDDYYEQITGPNGETSLELLEELKKTKKNKELFLTKLEVLYGEMDPIVKHYPYQLTINPFELQLLKNLVSKFENNPNVVPLIRKLDYAKLNTTNSIIRINKEKLSGNTKYLPQSGEN